MIKKISIAAGIIILLVAFTNKDPRAVIFTKLAPAPIGPYSQAIKQMVHSMFQDKLG